jgi:hypothetical protein
MPDAAKRLEAYLAADGIPLESPSTRAFLAAGRHRTSHHAGGGSMADARAREGPRGTTQTAAPMPNDCGERER